LARSAIKILWTASDNKNLRSTEDSGRDAVVGK